MKILTTNLIGPCTLRVSQDDHSKADYRQAYERCYAAGIVDYAAGGEFFIDVSDLPDLAQMYQLLIRKGGVTDGKTAVLCCNLGKLRCGGPKNRPPRRP